MSRLAEVWNSSAGVAPFDDLKPVKKFTSCKVAVARIWQAVGRQLPDAGPGATRRAEGHAVEESPAKGTRRVRAQKGAIAPREGSKKAEVLDLIRRSEGVTPAEIMKKAGWQAHIVRGFISLSKISKGDANPFESPIHVLMNPRACPDNTDLARGAL